MRLKETKQVVLFKFTDDKSFQVNIYVEPTDPGKGRLIISNQKTIFQRFFDGCNPDIFTFLSQQTAESICSCFDESAEQSKYFEKWTNYEYLFLYLENVWPLFIETIQGEIKLENADNQSIMQLTIMIEHVEGDEYNSSTTFPQEARANMVVNQLRACADVLENKIVEKVKTMDLPMDSIEDGFQIVRSLTMRDLI